MTDQIPTDHLSVEWVAIERVVDNPHNSRVHEPKQIEKIAASIKSVGITQPLLTDGNYNLIAGHGRLAAFRRLMLQTVPVIRLSHLTPAQARAYGIADNKLTDESWFDKKLLSVEIELILEDDAEFDLELTGFSGSDIELILDQGATEPTDPTPLPAIGTGPAVTQLGDLWTLGDHAVLCADATDPASYKTLLGKKRAQVVVSDPPYNLSAATISGRGAIKRREFVAASGELSDSDFARFLISVVGNMARACRDGAFVYLFIDHRHLLEMLQAGQAAGLSLVTICTWIKSAGSWGAPYRNQLEFVPVFKHGERPHIDNIQLGKTGRNRTNAWHYPGMNTFSAERSRLLPLHATIKNCDMIADAICDASHRGGLVLDPFGGSGTTLIAAYRTGRRAAMMELDPLYCDVIIRRVEQETGLKAVDADGVSFADREGRAQA